MRISPYSFTAIILVAILVAALIWAILRLLFYGCKLKLEQKNLQYPYVQNSLSRGSNLL